MGIPPHICATVQLTPGLPLVSGGWLRFFSYTHKPSNLVFLSLCWYSHWKPCLCSCVWLCVVKNWPSLAFPRSHSSELTPAAFTPPHSSGSLGWFPCPSSSSYNYIFLFLKRICFYFMRMSVCLHGCVPCACNVYGGQKGGAKSPGANGCELPGGC